MPKIFAPILAASLAVAATSFDAQAMPSSPATLAYQQNHGTLIGGRCPRGQYWSNIFQQCRSARR